MSLFENEENYTKKQLVEGDTVAGKYIFAEGPGITFKLSASNVFNFNMNNACMRPGQTFMVREDDSYPFNTTDMPYKVLETGSSVVMYFPKGDIEFVCPDDSSVRFTLTVDKNTTISRISGQGTIYELIPNESLYEVGE